MEGIMAQAEWKQYWTFVQYPLRRCTSNFRVEPSCALGSCGFASVPPPPRHEEERDMKRNLV